MLKFQVCETGYFYKATHLGNHRPDEGIAHYQYIRRSPNASSQSPPFQGNSCVSRFVCLVFCLRNSSVMLSMAALCSSSMLYKISVYKYTTIYLSTLLLTNIWVVTIFYFSLLLGIMLLCTFLYMHVFWLGVKLLGHR